MKNSDLLFIKVQAVERYSVKTAIPPKQVVKLFKSRGAFHALEKHYDVLHTQAPDYIIEYVEDIVRRGEDDKRY